MSATSEHLYRKFPSSLGGMAFWHNILMELHNNHDAKEYYIILNRNIIKETTQFFFEDEQWCGKLHRPNPREDSISVWCSVNFTKLIFEWGGKIFCIKHYERMLPIFLSHILEGFGRKCMRKIQISLWIFNEWYISHHLLSTNSML